MIVSINFGGYNEQKFNDLECSQLSSIQSTNCENQDVPVPMDACPGLMDIEDLTKEPEIIHSQDFQVSGDKGNNIRSHSNEENEFSSSGNKEHEFESPGNKECNFESSRNKEYEFRSSINQEHELEPSNDEEHDSDLPSCEEHELELSSNEEYELASSNDEFESSSNEEHELDLSSKKHDESIEQESLELSTKLVMMRFEKNLSNATLDLLLRVLSTSGIKVRSNSRSLIQSVKEVLTFLALRVLLNVGAKHYD